MSSDAAGPGPVIGPRPELPPRPPVPDDRIHGDSLPEARGGNAVRWPPAPTPPPRPLPPEGERAPRSRRRRWLPLLVIAGLAVVGMNRGFSSDAGEQTVTVPHAVTAVRINGDSGEVKVSAGATAGTVELTRRGSRDSSSSRSDADQKWEGTTLVLTPDAACGGMMSSCSAGYTVQVPNGTNVTVENDSGDIRLQGPLGTIDTKTDSGNIELDDVGSTSVTATTNSGNIDLSMVTVPNAVTMKADSGDVDVRLPKGATYAVDATSNSGGPKVKVDTSADSVHKIRVNTDSGDIKVEDR